MVYLLSFLFGDRFLTLHVSFRNIAEEDLIKLHLSESDGEVGNLTAGRIATPATPQQPLLIPSIQFHSSSMCDFFLN